MTLIARMQRNAHVNVFLGVRSRNTPRDSFY